MEKSKTAESPPLTEDEIADVDEFYSNKNDHKICSLAELLDELHSE